MGKKSVETMINHVQIWCFSWPSFHINVVILNILQANWYKAEQYCRFHGMHLASINSADEQRNLEEHITSFGREIYV